MFIRSALFWDITRPRTVIVYRRFGTTYQSHLHWSGFISFLLGLLTREDVTDTLSRKFGKQLSRLVTELISHYDALVIRCVCVCARAPQLVGTIVHRWHQNSALLSSEIISKPVEPRTLIPSWSHRRSGRHRVKCGLFADRSRAVNLYIKTYI
jgi:hypothetical protein